MYQDKEILNKINSPIDFIFHSIEGEIWKDITIDNLIQVKSIYAISNKGRVLNKRDNVILQPLINYGSRLYVYFEVIDQYAYNGIYKPEYIDRIVLHAFGKDGYNKNKRVNYIDGNLYNCCIENLTQSKTFHPHKDEYTNGQIQFVCKLLQKGHGYDYISKATGVDKRTVKDIKCQKKYIYISNYYSW